jgi:hypothetical protein
MSKQTSKITVQNSVTDTARVVVYSELNGSTRTIPWSVFKSDLELGDDSVITISASQAVSAFNTIYFVDATTTNLTMTLASAANMKGKWVVFKKIDTSVNTVTLTPNGGETIDLDTSLVLSGSNAFVKITSDGTNWKITNA